MGLQLGNTAPDFEADTTEGPIRFHDWIGDPWAVLFSHPKDSRPCAPPSSATWPRSSRSSTGATPSRRPVVDPVDRHEGWRTTSRRRRARGQLPHHRGRDLAMSKAYGMLPAETSGPPRPPHPGRQPDRPLGLRRRPRQEDQADPRVPDDDGPQLRRGPARARLDEDDGQVQGVHARQLEPGDDVIIAGSCQDDAAKKMWPEGWEWAEAVHPDRPGSGRRQAAHRRLELSRGPPSRGRPSLKSTSAKALLRRARHDVLGHPTCERMVPHPSSVRGSDQGVSGLSAHGRQGKVVA